MEYRSEGVPGFLRLGADEGSAGTERTCGRT